MSHQPNAIGLRQWAIGSTSLGMLLLPGLCLAAIYDGAGPGTSLIDPAGAGDYTTLAAAVASINATPLTGGDWTFELKGDLVESTDSALCVETGDSRLVFRPAAGEDVTVTFASGDYIQGDWPAHWTIGSSGSDSAPGPTHLTRVSILGTDADGGGSLLLGNTTLSKKGALVAAVNNADDFVLRGVTLQSGATKTLLGVGFAVYIPSVNVPGSFPERGLVEDCEILVNGHPRGTGILFQKLGGRYEPGGAADGWRIAGNRIIASGYGMQFTRFANLDIEGNTVSVEKSTPGTLTSTIIAISARSRYATEDSHLRIVGNRIEKVTASVDFSQAYLWGINAGYEGGSGNGRVTIASNSIAGIYGYSTDAEAEAGSLCGIFGYIGLSDFRIWNNSIHIPASPDTVYTYSELVANGAIAVYSEYNRPFDIRNNVMEVDNDSVFGFAGEGLPLPGSPSSIVTDNNNISVSGPTFAYSGIARFTGRRFSIDEWRSVMGFEQHSTTRSALHPTSATGGWTSETDHCWTSPPANAFRGVPIAEITHDINGTPRNPTSPTKGACETPGGYIELAEETLGVY